MAMLIADNTTAMGYGASYSTPSSFLRQKGLMGLGEDIPLYTTENPTMADSLQTLITGANAEAVFLMNLYRLQNNQTPLDPRYTSPAVNVGLTAEGKQTAMIAGLGLLALVMFARPQRAPARQLRRRRFYR